MAGFDFYRSSAPNSLSIWTHYLTGMTFYNGFVPKGGCAGTIDATAVTVAAGHDMIDIYAATDAYNLTVVGGEAHTVGIGGYIQAMFISINAKMVIINDQYRQKLTHVLRVAGIASLVYGSRSGARGDCCFPSRRNSCGQWSVTPIEF
jgi:hypothetical protein